MVWKLRLRSQKIKTSNLSQGIPFAFATPALQAALSNPTLTEFLAKSSVLKPAPLELSDPNYGKGAPPNPQFPNISILLVDIFRKE